LYELLDKRRGAVSHQQSLKVKDYRNQVHKPEVN
jgi:hypothetical protein